MARMLSGLGWPLAAVVIAGLFFLIFREPITRLIDRIRSVSRSGIQADPGDQEGAIENEGTTADEILREVDNALVVRAEERIRDEFENRDVIDAAERERVLRRYFAGLSIAYSFLRIYHRIYGSQITALQVLAAHGGEGAQTDALRTFYNQGANDRPNLYVNYSFENWLQWLEDTSLLVRENGRVSLTLEGREFLKFLLDQGLNPYKKG